MPSKSSQKLGNAIAYVSIPATLPKQGTLALTYLLLEVNGRDFQGYRRGLPNTYITSPKVHSQQKVQDMLGRKEITAIKGMTQIQEGQLVVVDSEGAIHIAKHPDRTIVQAIGQMPLGTI